MTKKEFITEFLIHNYYNANQSTGTAVARANKAYADLDKELTRIDFREKQVEDKKNELVKDLAPKPKRGRPFKDPAVQNLTQTEQSL